MKTFKLILLVLILITTSCNKYKDQAAQLQSTNQELSNSLEQCNALLKEYQNTLSEVDVSLNQTLPDSEQAARTNDLGQLKTRINNAIDEINTLLQENEQQQQNLRNRSYRMNSRVSGLEEQITELNSMLENRDSIITSCNQKVSELNSSIEDLNSEVGELNNQNTRMNERAESLTDSLNFAYYTAGSIDELRDKSIIQKTGGFLGFLGQVKKLDPQLDRNQLERIDIRNKTTFDIDSEADDIEIVSTHPQGSYTVESSGEETARISINDSEEFWKISRYLILVTD